MDSVQERTQSTSALPTREHPEPGVYGIFDVEIARGEYWFEDGEYVIRSTEFDVIAAGPTFAEALSNFGDNVIAFAVYLAELADPAENEVEMLGLLAPRLVRLMRSAKRAESRARRRRLLGVTVTLSRRRGDDASRWHRSGPHNSSLPSLA